MTGNQGVVAPIPRILRAGTLLVLAAAMLAACSPRQNDQTATGVYRLLGSQRAPGLETLEQTVEYVLVPPTRAMVSAPDATLLFERTLGNAVEQRIILPNQTAVQGDNVIHVRAQTSSSADLSRFNMAEVSARFGGLPAPFERLSEGALTSGNDSLGTYVYARENVGANTVCVLVLRRMGLGARPLPRGTQALDVLMRNCVNGSLEQALAPMSARALAVTGTVGSTNTLSPYAAPGG